MNRQRNIQRDRRTGLYFVQIRRQGVRRNFYLGACLKAAQRRLKAVERDIEAGRISFATQDTSATVVGGRRDIQVAELVVRHLAWVKASRAAGTFALRQHYVFQFLAFLKLGHMEDGKFAVTGAMLMSELTRSLLTDFHLWGREHHPDSPNAGNEALRQVKTMLLWGLDQELCDLPFKKFPAIHVVPAPTKRASFDDLAKLLEKAPRDLVDLVRFGLLTGLRPQELRELTVDQIVKPDNGVWFVRLEKHKTTGRTKEKSVRTVPLSDQAREIIQRQRTSHPFSAHVFLNSDGTPYTHSVLRRRLARACHRAHVPNITPYALRHTFASIESDAHVESTALARLMGHSTVRTLARYISNSTEHDLQAVQTAANVLSIALGKAS